MSEGINTTMLFGNLGADPELRHTSGGPVLKMRLATNEVWFDKDKNEKKERTEWHNVTVFGRRAEGLHKVLSKGSRIFVNGRLRTSTYEKDGVKHYFTEIVATDIILAGGARPSTNGFVPRVPQPAAPSASSEAPF